MNLADELKKVLVPKFQDRLKAIAAEKTEGKKAVRKGLLIYLAVIVSEILIIVYLTNTVENFPRWAGVIVLGTLVVGLFFIPWARGLTKRQETYKKIQHEIFEMGCSILMPSMRFNETGLTLDELNASGLNGDRKIGSSTFISNNQMEGVVHDLSIRFGFCHQHYTRSSTDSNGKTSRSQVDLFKNTLLVMDSPVKWAGHTHVLTDTTERMVGSMLGDLASKFLSDNEPAIRFNENPEFEKYFRVHSDNENEARSIINSHMQVWIMGIFRKLGRVQLSFKEDKIYIEVPTYIPETIDDFDINWYIEAISKYQIISMGIAEDMISMLSGKKYESSQLQKAYHELIVASPDKEDITDQLLGFTGKAGKGCLFFISIMIIIFGSIFTLIGIIVTIVSKEVFMLAFAAFGIPMLFVGYMLFRTSRKKSPVKTQ